MPVDLWDQKLEDAFARAKGSGCLWPAPYDQDTLESAMAFVRECRTWNETEKQIQPMPDLDYFWNIGAEWFKAKREGSELHILKARRMVVSWFCRCLELHQMGLSRQDWLLGGEKYGPACKHVWRLEHLYEDLRREKLLWKLPPSKHLLFEGDRSLKQFSLANGSVCTAVNGEGNNVQGEGLTGVVFEEASLYPHLESMIGQAKIITQASAGHSGGFIVTIANPEHNHSYWELVGGHA